MNDKPAASAHAHAIRGAMATRKIAMARAAEWDWDRAIEGLRAILAEVYGERESGDR